MASNNNRGRDGRNNNPSGHNQYSDWGVMEMVRERPVAAAVAAAGAAAAGVFLWSKRSQIGNQLNTLSDQIGEWTQNMTSAHSGDEFPMDDTAGLTTTGKSSRRSTSAGNRSKTGRARGMSETGGGNASLGARSGGGGTTLSASGRGRGQSTPAS
jgi:hypothetical protein